MGYQLKKHEPYVITGKEGKEYVIPAQITLNLDGIDIICRFNNSTDELEKIRICKEFFLHFAPELEEEEIGDMEYFKMFLHYTKETLNDPKDLGEN